MMATVPREAQATGPATTPARPITPITEAPPMTARPDMVITISDMMVLVLKLAISVQRSDAYKAYERFLQILPLLKLFPFQNVLNRLVQMSNTGKSLFLQVFFHDIFHPFGVFVAASTGSVNFLQSD